MRSRRSLPPLGARYLAHRGPSRAGPGQLAAGAGLAISPTCKALREVVPDVADHDVYLCGSDGWMYRRPATAAIDAGVPHDASCTSSASPTDP